ncbi:calcium-activated chloride channel regulator 1-like isoform X1 [Carcharodon carcharias]|uniref:calcium-activated chloride channel regulator 1-like isoform X1 n=1 Tax=Carcharodon carcharias TaxID=13397 RepID=UPI001B7F41EE|nr:calcium-activated chloride channel regulator 1-like isoform X1 [Carcharodon carcharias]
MKFQKTLGLVLSCILCDYIVNSSGGRLENNGYRDIVIAMKPGIQHNDELIENIQEIVTEASFHLHRATKQQVYFADVKILLPQSWPVRSSSVHRPKTESYEKADVIIAEPYLKYGDEPYTLQYGGCGEKGRYIHFTPNFILNSSLTQNYGSKGKVFVHEWAHLRWGVFDEYNNLVPFYLSNGTYEATRCSKKIVGKISDCTSSPCTSCDIDPNSGLPKGNCKFYPAKSQTSSSSIMYMQALSNVVEFCDEKTHNPEAPNMQNKMCNQRSTWDVIKESEDFRNNRPPHIGPVIPTFTILQAKDRVLCLVLDISGSMGSENRINRLRQAAEIFLLQIIEVQSQVGVVTFNSAASIQTDLKVIDDENVRDQLVRLLPTSANGGTNICAGVQSGFRVLRGDDGATNGDEIVLLTDGEDSGISSCFAEVEQSGSVIHTIALGPGAAVELEQLSKMTGGSQFAATDNVDASGLIDAFTGLVSGNGDISQQSIQLESSGTRIDDDSWLNNTVFIDKTVGNDTFFVVTWETQTPYMFVHDPNGKVYDSGDFGIDATVRTARLNIFGTAQAGPWMYSILNPGTEQIITITVTSRAADVNVPPITVNVHIREKDSGGTIIYAEVSQGFSPVMFAKVTAIIERPTGPPVEQDLSDDGLAADVVKNDGIYTKFFHKYSGYGRYNFKVRVEGKEGTTKTAIRTGAHAFYIPGYTENGMIQTNLPRPAGNTEDLQAELGDFSRVKSGGVISVPAGTPIVDFPPCKITDLQATIVKNKVELEWTAPGDDYDQGAASRYEMRMSDNLLQLRDNFSTAALVNLTSLNPQPYGSREAIAFVPENTKLQNGTNIYFALCAYDTINQSSEMSNVAKASVYVPFIEHAKGNNSKSEVVWSVIVVTILVCLIIGIINYLVQRKKTGTYVPEACN